MAVGPMGRRIAEISIVTISSPPPLVFKTVAMTIGRVDCAVTPWLPTQAVIDI